jgi:hypothetical protein
MNDIKNRKSPNDKIYTPPSVAKKMIEICNILPTDKVLDPSKGGGVFYDNLPECIKSYCEIEEDIDFFDYNDEVDIIVGNPPFSLWNKWIDKTIQLNPKKVCYIYGVFNMTPKRFERFENNGYKIQKVVLVDIEWWLGASFIVLMEKKPNDFFEFVPNKILCEKCGLAKCKRKPKDGSSFDINKCRFETTE